MNAKVYTTDGDVYEVTPKNGKDFKLEELQKIVNGWIEIIRLENDKVMVINEEGLLLNLDINFEATRMVGFGAMIVGDVLVCDSKMVK